MTIDWDKVKTKAVKFTAAAAPVTRVLERTVVLASRLPTITPIGVAGMASAGINAAHDWLKERTAGYGRQFSPWMRQDLLVPALVAAGATVTKHERLEGGMLFQEMRVGGESFSIRGDGTMVCCPTEPAFETWLRGAIDAALPAAAQVERGENTPTCKPAKLAQFETDRGAEIADATRPFLADGPRTILLNGKPGVGKTTMAQEIARRMGLGRTVIVPNALIGSSADGFEMAASNPTPTARSTREEIEGLRLLSPAVVIVDDVDKVRIYQHQLEQLRGSARLVILTANNAEAETVLDAATCRPERIDEFFALTSERTERAAPFDRLDDATWHEVREWPVGYQNELAARIRHRGTTPSAMRLEDLRERLARRTRSRSELL